MSTFRIHKSRNYTVMSNHHLQNNNLSLRAMGLLSYMLSKPDDWVFSVEGIAAKCRDGKDSVRSAVKELEEHGYIVRRPRARDENGHLKEAVYDVYELPDENPDFEAKDKKDEPLKKPAANSTHKKAANKIPADRPMADFPPLVKSRKGSPMADFPTLVKPTQENPSLLNTNIPNTNITNLSINQVSSSSNNKNKIHIGRKNYEMDDAMIDDGIDVNIFDETVTEVGEQVDVESLYSNNKNRLLEIDELIDIIATVYITKRSSIKIGGESLNVAIIRKRLKSLTSSHIQYVLDCVSKVQTKINNRRNYLLTCLYNTPFAISAISTKTSDRKSSFDINDLVGLSMFND